MPCNSPPTESRRTQYTWCAVLILVTICSLFVSMVLSDASSRERAEKSAVVKAQITNWARAEGITIHIIHNCNTGPKTCWVSFDKMEPMKLVRCRYGTCWVVREKDWKG